MRTPFGSRRSQRASTAPPETSTQPASARAMVMVMAIAMARSGLARSGLARSGPARSGLAVRARSVMSAGSTLPALGRAAKEAAPPGGEATVLDGALAAPTRSRSDQAGLAPVVRRFDLAGAL